MAEVEDTSLARAASSSLLKEVRTHAISLGDARARHFSSDFSTPGTATRVPLELGPLGLGWPSAHQAGQAPRPLRRHLPKSQRSGQNFHSLPPVATTCPCSLVVPVGAGMTLSSIRLPLLSTEAPPWASLVLWGRPQDVGDECPPSAILPAGGGPEVTVEVWWLLPFLLGRGPSSSFFYSLGVFPGAHFLTSLNISDSSSKTYKSWD